MKLRRCEPCINASRNKINKTVARDPSVSVRVKNSIQAGRSQSFTDGLFEQFWVDFDFGLVWFVSGLV